MTRTIYLRKSKRASRGGPSPIAREHTAHPNQTLRQCISHKGTKARRWATLIPTALSSTPRHPTHRHPTPRHPELVSGSYYFDVGSKILKRVQDDEDGHQNHGDSAPHYCFPWHRTARIQESYPQPIPEILHVISAMRTCLTS